MAKWIFLEDFELAHKLEQAVNLSFVVSITQHTEETGLVMFFSGAHTDPIVLTFKTKASCQAAYDKLKSMLRAEK